MEAGLKEEIHGVSAPRLLLCRSSQTHWLRMERWRTIWAEALPWSGMCRTYALRMDAPRPRRGPSSLPLCTPRHRPSKPHLSLRLLLRKIDWSSWTLLGRPGRKEKKQRYFRILDWHSIKKESWHAERDVLGEETELILQSSSIPFMETSWVLLAWDAVNSFIHSIFQRISQNRMGYSQPLERSYLKKWNLEKSYRWTYLQSRNKDTGREQMYGHQGGWIRRLGLIHSHYNGYNR